MYYKEQYDPTENDQYEVASTDQKGVIENMKKMDKGYNKIWRMLPRADDTLKRTKIEFYTSGDTGHKIRDAETGTYYNDLVGSANEDLYFKVGLATGECTSANKSSTLFFTSPQRYITRMHATLTPEIIANWEAKRDARLDAIGKKSNPSNVFVN
jgi:hypothetical protein